MSIDDQKLSINLSLIWRSIPACAEELDSSHNLFSSSDSEDMHLLSDWESIVQCDDLEPMVSASLIIFTLYMQYYSSNTQTW